LIGLGNLFGNAVGIAWLAATPYAAPTLAVAFFLAWNSLSLIAALTVLSLTFIKPMPFGTPRP
jgi:hypothetical protein